MKTARYQERDFDLQNVGTAYESGYEVRFKGRESRNCWVQFHVFLNSALRLVPVISRISGGVSAQDLFAAKAIVTEELSENPSVFHVVENGFHEMKRLERAIEEAVNLRQVPCHEPHVVATQNRITNLKTIVRDAREWAGSPGRGPFRDFMKEHEIAVPDRDFNVEDKFEVGDDFGFHPSMGPVELLHEVYGDKRCPSVVVVSEISYLTSVRRGVAERRCLDWPRLDSENTEKEIIQARAHEFFPEISEKIIAKLAQDSVVIGWTSQTETAAFEKILSKLQETGFDPRVVIGSPEGTFSGRASAIRNAISSTHDRESVPESRTCSH